ncbi:MAG: ATP-binding protein, partial [Synergistaceae bacterium]|nr:ATP-binding protein [Synergistaceae bacterium]
MDIQETLRNHNPFASVAAANPWANAMPDIESLNHEAAEQIFNLALNKLRNPQSPMAGLILGEAGSGKTHMLRRVLDRIRRSGADVVFVCVKAFTLPQKVMRDLWREVFVSLTRERGDGFTQLEFIAAGMTGIYRGQASGEAGAHLDETGCVRYFQSILPEVRGDFLRALLACRRRARKEEAGPTVWGRLKTLMGGSAAREEERRRERKRLEEESLGKRRRDAALRWLQGEIDDEHPRLLGVGDRAAMPPAELEAEAKDWLLSLGLVLDRCGISMTVCFDQLDGMDDPALIGAWEKALAFLVNDVYGMLPLVFVKAATWRRRFSALDESLEQRLTGNRFQLKNCTLEQARELVRARVAAFHPGDGEAGEIAAWLLERLEGKLKNGSPPRVVLDLANRAVVQSEGAEPAAPENAAEVLAEAYREERQKVRDDLDAWPPDADRLLIALETHLAHRGDFEDIRRPEGKYISLTALRAEDKKEEGVPCA